MHIEGGVFFFIVGNGYKCIMYMLIEFQNGKHFLKL